MADRVYDDVCRIVQVYASALVGDEIATLVELFTSGATLRDPGDGDPIVGADAIRAYFRAGSAAVLRMEPSGPVRLLNDSSVAAVPFRVDVMFDGSTNRLDSIDVFEFDANRKITAMTGYYGGANFRAAPR